MLGWSKCKKTYHRCLGNDTLRPSVFQCGLPSVPLGDACLLKQIYQTSGSSKHMYRYLKHLIDSDCRILSHQQLNIAVFATRIFESEYTKYFSCPYLVTPRYFDIPLVNPGLFLFCIALKTTEQGQSDWKDYKWEDTLS